MSARNPGPAVAVVGCGYWGQNLVRNFAELGALVAVSDASASTTATTSAAYGVASRRFEDVLGDPAVDGVVIAAPAVSHAELATEALVAGKHVFVEKPLALRAADAERVCDIAKRMGRTLMVGHLLQYHPVFVRLRELVEEGLIGRVHYLYSNRLNLGRIRREEDILWSFAPHDISMILSLVRAEPEKVSAIGARYLHKTIADVTTTHLSFPGGEQAHVFVSWLHPFKEQKLVVTGDRGMLVFDDGQPWPSKLTHFEHRIDWHQGVPRPVRAEGQPVSVPEDEPLELECRHFLDCISSGATPRTDGREGLRVLRVLEAASQSLLAETPVVADESNAERVAGDVKFYAHESAYLDEGAVVGDGTKIWHFSHVMANSRVGDNCSLGQNVMIGPNVVVGDNCRIQNNVSIYEGVTLENGVFCGPSCVFTNVRNPRAEVSRRNEFQQTHVRRGASIGANATIVCGNDVGAYSFIAAGAVVTSEVPAHALMVGVPARRVGWVSHHGEILGPDLVCPRTGRKYVELGPDVLAEVDS